MSDMTKEQLHELQETMDLMLHHCEDFSSVHLSSDFYKQLDILARQGLQLREEGENYDCNLAIRDKQIADMKVELAAAEAKCERLKVAWNADAFSEKEAVECEKRLDELFNEPSTDALTTYIREQTNEVVEALGAQLTVPDFFHHISCDCGQCVNLKNANKKGMRQAVEKALAKLKQIRGEK